MLHGENFRGRHQRGLVAVFDDDGRGFERHDGLAAADVALQQAVHRHAALQVRRDFRERALLRVGGLEGQHALDRFANGRLAHAKRDPRLLLRRLLPHRDAQLVKEKLLENQPQVRRRAKRIQRLDRFRRGRKMHELDRVAPRRKFVARQNFRGQRIGQRAGKFFERQINDAPHRARADAADGFVNRNDAADFGRVRVSLAEQFVFRIDHLDPAGPHRIQLRLAVKHEPLPGLECFLEIVPVKKFAGERARLVAHEQVIDAAARARVADQAAAQDLRANGVDLSRRDLANFCEVDAVFVAEGQIAEQVFKRPQPALAREFPRGAAPRLSGTSARLWASRTFLVYITHQ